MPKRIGYLYEKLTSWSNLYLAYKKACKHKKHKGETSEWMYNCERYLFDLQSELVERRYQAQPYKYFTIYEPKERVISVAAFRDRVVHHALLNVIEPYFEAIFIKDSYATRKGKGLHKAVRAAQAYAKQYEWYLKLDIKKYFASINHNVLIELICRKIKDPHVISLCQIILSNQTESMGMAEKRGIPVGNLSSQFFANIYLHTLDQYVKQVLRFKAYVRYMDDFVLFADDKQSLLKAHSLIEQYLQNELELRIKAKSFQLNKVIYGIPFLGYRVFPQLLRIRKENLQRCLRGIQKAEKAYTKERIGLEKLYQSTRSRMGFIGFANSQKLQNYLWGRNQQAGLTV